MGICMGLGIVTSILAPILMKKFSARTLAACAFGVQVVAGVVIYLVGKSNLAVLFVCFGAVGLTVGMLMVTITTMLTQTAGYVAERQGYRADGTCFSMNSFSIKVGQAIASAVVSFLLAATGYVAGAEQSATALTGILLSRSVIPAIVGALGLICVLSWNISKKER
jgi:Na+/melibiose symporter-like transporter